MKIAGIIFNQRVLRMISLSANVEKFLLLLLVASLGVRMHFVHLAKCFTRIYQTNQFKKKPINANSENFDLRNVSNYNNIKLIN